MFATACKPSSDMSIWPGSRRREVVHPFANLLAVFLRHTEHLCDHFDREQRGEVLYDIERFGLGASRCSGRWSRSPWRRNASMARGVKTLLTRLRICRCSGGSMMMIIFASHRFVWLAPAPGRAVCRRIGFKVLVRGGYIFVPGQRVEVMLLVVVDRRFLAHSPVDLPGTVEELLGERVEDELRSRSFVADEDGLPRALPHGFLDLLLVLGCHLVLQDMQIVLIVEVEHLGDDAHAHPVALA